jgi:hypothetical protein
MPYTHEVFTNLVANFAIHSSRSVPRFVRPNDQAGVRQQISSGGGTEPQWQTEGSELFYVAGDRNLMAVRVKLSGTFEAGVPKPLFPIELGGANIRWNYAVSGDGRRVLMKKASGEMNPITVVLNWTAGLKR